MLSADTLETLRHHAAKGVSPATLADWFGLPSARAVRDLLATTETAPSDDVPPLREAEGLEVKLQPSAKPSGQSDRSTSSPNKTPRAGIFTASTYAAGIQARTLSRRLGDDGRVARPLSIRPGFVGSLPRTCQWIEGAPTPDDSCKCGAPVEAGRPYCPTHQRRAYRTPTTTQ